MSDQQQQQHLLAFVQDGSVECGAISDSKGFTSAKRHLRKVNVLKKSHTLGGSKEADVRRKVKGGRSLEGQDVSWKLNYRDILPAPLPASSKATDGYWEKSENFQKLVERANNWLKKNVGVRLKSCETVTCSSSDRNKMASWTGREALSSRSMADGSNTYFARGLRLWLAPSGDSEERENHLSYFDVVPEIESRTSHLVTIANKKIDEKQIRRRVIVSFDTVSCPLYRNNIHNNATRWIENVDQDCPNAYVLRTFYMKSQARRQTKDGDDETLNIKDFQPKKTRVGYEGFEVLVEKANNFIKQQLLKSINIDICSLQSVLIYKNQDASNNGGPYCYFTTPGINAQKPIEMFRVLRLCYFGTPVISGQQMTSLPSAMLGCSKIPSACRFSTLTYETFVPELADGDKRVMEMMDEVFPRVTQFLQTYDTEVLCAETVVNPIQMYYKPEVIKGVTRPLDERRDDADDDDSMFFIFTLRLFLTSSDGTSRILLMPHIPLSPAAPNETQATTQGHAQQPSEGNKASHAPLFLRNVVGRQFKYRWLALALSSFTCMAVIVAVSVIYSNK